MLSKIKKDIPPGLVRIVREKKDIKKTLLLIVFSLFVIITGAVTVFLYKERIIPEIKSTSNMSVTPQPMQPASSTVAAFKAPETEPEQKKTEPLSEKPSESVQKTNTEKKESEQPSKTIKKQKTPQKTIIEKDREEKSEKPQPKGKPVEIPIEALNMETFKGADILYRASDLEAKGRLTDAISEYKEYLRITGKQDPKILNKIATLYLSTANLSEASRYAEMALKESPDSVAIILNYGVIKAKMGNLKEAEECFRKVLSMHPENRTALYNLAFLKEQKKEYEEARKLYEKLYQLGDPQAFEALQRLKLQK